MAHFLKFQPSSENVATFSVDRDCWPNFRRESLGTRAHDAIPVEA